MLYVLFFLRISCVFAVAVAANNWRQKMQKSTWDVALVRRALDTQITLETREALTLIGCGVVCSNVFGVTALSLYFVHETHTCYCNDAIDNNPEDNGEAELYYGTMKTYNMEEELDEETKKTTVWPYQLDCFSLYMANYREDGVYSLAPTGNMINAWCDMTNGGWTVIQRRKDGSVDFYRGWTDYVHGFGEISGEFWLGLENIHHLTKNGSHLEIFLEAFPGVTPSSTNAHYTSFKVKSSASNYEVEITGFTGDCGDSMAYHNGQQFSTFDKENDVHISLNCAETHGGAWWHKRCHESNLNGIYYQDAEFVYDGSHANGILWKGCWGFQFSLKTSVMKVRSQ